MHIFLRNTLHEIQVRNLSGEGERLSRVRVIYRRAGSDQYSWRNNSPEQSSDSINMTDNMGYTL